VKPELGKAIIFYNIDNNLIVIKESLHGGLEVINGNKWIATKWIHKNIE
jgi:prolyl 4-hydroxylase